MTLRVTAAEFVKDWSAGAQAATGKYRRGIEKVTESPTEKAADKIDTMVANFNAAAANGKIEAGLRRVSLVDWRTVTLAKGAANLAAGVKAAEPKMAKVAPALLSAIDEAATKARGMASGTLADSIARMTSFVTDMAAFKKPA